MEKSIRIFVNKDDRSLWFSKDYYNEINDGKLILFPYNCLAARETYVLLEHLDKWLDLEVYINQLRKSNKLLIDLAWAKDDCQKIMETASNKNNSLDEFMNSDRKQWPA